MWIFFLKGDNFEVNWYLFVQLMRWISAAQAVKMMKL